MNTLIRSFNVQSSKVCNGPNPMAQDTNMNESLSQLKAQIKSELKKMDDYGLIYHELELELIRNADGSYKMEDGNYKKKIKKIPFKYENVEHEKSVYTGKYNGTSVFMGEFYNIIGIDVDNKSKTVEEYDKVCESNLYVPDTFTMKTMNDGYHYYYTLTDEQIEGLKGFCALNGGLFDNQYIDVKYNNQLLFGPSYFELDNGEFLKYEIFNDVAFEYLPNFIYNEIVKQYKSKAKSKIQKPLKELKPNKLPVIEQTDKLEIDNKLDLYMSAINKSRLDNYKDWITLGYVIYNRGNNVKLWDHYSKISSKYKSGECEKKWMTFKNEADKEATIYTIKKWAESDNNQAYLKCFMQDKSGILKKIFSEGITDIYCSYLFYSIYKSKYIYVPQNKTMYYQNQYGIYEKDINNKEINLSIACLKKIVDNKFKKLYDLTTDEEKKNKLCKINIQIKRYLMTKKTIDVQIDMIKILYTDDKIYEKMDSVNPNIIAFTNGVYDLQNNIFRNAKPEELITETTGYEYKEADPIIIKEIYKILEDIFPDKGELQYIINTLSYSLIGNNKLQEFYLWLGSGGNGKGILRDLMQNTLGNYFGTMEIDYLIDTRHQGHANSADPIMARLKNARLVITTEPNGGANLRCNKLKQLSGNDSVTVRHLYGESFSFVPKFKLIIQTNKQVAVDGSDGGIKRRLSFIEFPNKFVDNPTKPNERKIDINLSEKLKDNKYSLAMFHILKDAYINIKDKKIERPPRIKADTEKYLNDCNSIKTFLDEHGYEITDKEKDRVNASTIYSEYEDYCNTAKVRKQTQRDFKSYLCTELGCSHNRFKDGIKYVKIKKNVINHFENKNDDE